MPSSTLIHPAAVLPPSMQVIEVMNPGANSCLVTATRSLPALLPGQLLLKVHAAGVNRADLMQRRGLYPPQPNESDILGLEASGEVVAVADDHLSHWLGKSVMALVPGGGYAEYVRVDALHVMQTPKGWSMHLAAAAPEVFLTAYQLLFELGQLEAGQRVLLHAGASGVGTAAIQLAKACGAEVAVTVGNQKKADACLALGADLAIDYRQQDFVAVLSQQWPTGVNLILDPVAGDYLVKDAALLAMDAKVVIYALMGGRQTEFDMAPWFKKRAQLLFSTLRNRSDHYKAELVRHLQADFAAAFAVGRIQPVMHSVLPWSEAEQAHQLLATNQSIGKVVLNIASSTLDATLSSGTS
ncbi:NAD(P)H-quinone oxidoreductase [Alkalimonas sp. MEB108]|uniref:NAD(P)H-quinone oxidoreductase n=1 Tax=Alkalimonas cellulosilytica TaxID=3058395 RepID=A0ABU7J4R0_9GAMM|nr:NAD(P)H-quinone oxidoreductase [Alkalimonas sp. MEB108]MEE2001422.1 NAD(P)H-quinone oxidoreductase [Alkalimonas sp. MEB108]